MSQTTTDITADAVALQERDEFRSQGWIKVLAPAKVNLHLAIGQLRDDGYHEATSIMHALTLHDIVYVRHAVPDAYAQTVFPGTSLEKPCVHMVACGDVAVPSIAPGHNIAERAALELGRIVGRDDVALQIRIEKNIPAEGGLGGGSSDAAAVLVAAAHLWGLAPDDPAIEQAARALGSDVAFFLHGGCSHYEGTGELFARALEPSRRSVVLVKPAGGVSTAEAYRAFDSDPQLVPDEVRSNATSAQSADDLLLFNNLAPASERLMPELSRIREWLDAQPGNQGTLLCGSGATTFALCADLPNALTIVAEARKLGYWARATSFGPLRAMMVSV